MACVILVPALGMELKPPMSEVQSLNHWEVLQKLVFKKKIQAKDFPGSPVVKTPCWQCREHSFDHCSGELKGMATHSTIPAWRIPWTEEPGGLRSMGS